MTAIRSPCDEAVLRAAPQSRQCSDASGPAVLAAAILGSTMAFVVACSPFAPASYKIEREQKRGVAEQAERDPRPREPVFERPVTLTETRE